jgi:hypothetical protein
VARPPRSFPLESLRASLNAARESGDPFELAFLRAVGFADHYGPIDWPRDSTLRREWRQVILETKPTWERAYYRLPQTPGERALIDLASLLDEEPLVTPAAPDVTRDPRFDRAA